MKLILKLGAYCSLLSLFFLFFTGCQDNLSEENVVPSTDNTTLNVSEDSDIVVLGEQLKNPYSTEVMRQAATNIDARVSIETTHLYVKFSPRTEEELEQLYADSTLTLFSYPLD